LVKRILFPGRFQPFHNGHLKVLTDLLDRFDEIVIVVGSAQEGYTCRNPFTAGERIEMIDRVLGSMGIDRGRYWLIPVPDLHKPLAWTSYVLSMVPKVDAVASGNPHTIYIFKWLGFPVIEVELVDGDRFNGTHIRRTMCSGGEWATLVPKEVYEYIVSINGVERVRRVCSGEYC